MIGISPASILKHPGRGSNGAEEPNVAAPTKPVGKLSKVVPQPTMNLCTPPCWNTGMTTATSRNVDMFQTPPMMLPTTPNPSPDYFRAVFPNTYANAKLREQQQQQTQQSAPVMFPFPKQSPNFETPSFFHQELPFSSFPNYAADPNKVTSPSFSSMFPPISMLAPYLTRMSPPQQLSRTICQTPQQLSNKFHNNHKDDTMFTLPPVNTNRKRSMSSSDEESKLSSLSGGLSPVPPLKRERFETTKSIMDENSEMGLGGESRLKISFSNLGSPGAYPQVFGKSRLGVPDGLSGTYVLYSERWKSEIVHERDSFESDDGTRHVLVTWKITNLTSGVTQSRSETPKEAILRHKDGRTLCNKVFRRALEQRATDLETDLKLETNPIRIKTMKNLIKKLRPKHFSEGPLVFGLRHESVQNRFRSMTMMDEKGILRLKSTEPALQ